MKPTTIETPKEEIRKLLKENETRKVPCNTLWHKQKTLHYYLEEGFVNGKWRTLDWWVKRFWLNREVVNKRIYDYWWTIKDSLEICSKTKERLKPSIKDRPRKKRKKEVRLRIYKRRDYITGELKNT